MRLVRGLGALLTLLLGMVAVPVVLVVIGRGLIPESLSWSAALGALLRPDDGSIVLRLLLLMAAVAWLIFAVSVVAEAIGFVSGYRISVRVPGLGGTQRLVAGLLLAVVAMITVPQPTQATTPTVSAARTAELDTSTRSDPVALSAPVSSAPAPATADAEAADLVMHRVDLGDDLWSLAERYYGTGRDWRRIATANPDRLTGGPDRLQVGWLLRIPGATRPAKPVSAATNASVPSEMEVIPGDTLSGLAQRVYGDEARWREIYAANAHQLDDPDELRVGMTLRIPPPNPKESEAQTSKGSPKAEATEPAPETAEAPQTPDASEPPEPPEPAAPPVGPPTADRPGGTTRVETPSAAAPSTGTPTSPTAPTATTPVAQAPTVVDPPDPGAPQTAWPLAAPLAGVGGLLAAGFIAGLVARRRLQLQARPLGRRILHPSAESQQVEAILGRRSRPLSVRTLDLALRAIAAHAHRTNSSPPRLAHAMVADDQIVLELSESVDEMPDGFEQDGRGWRLDPASVDSVRAIEGLAEAPRPYPALVTIGADEAGAAVLLDLEATGLLALRSDDHEVVAAVLLAMATELAFAPGADEMTLTLVGGDRPLADALARHNVSVATNVDDLLDRLELRARDQRREAPDGPARYRVDPALAEPWAPEILLVTASLSQHQSRRLSRLITAEPPVTFAAVLANPSIGCPATVRIESVGHSMWEALLEPVGLRVRPQLIGVDARSSLTELVAVTGDDRTTAAPWWPEQPPDPPPDNVAYLSRRAEGWAGGTRIDEPEEVAQMIATIESGATPAHPVLRMLGPVELEGATGPLPPRAAKQCLEYCGWLLENPGTSAPQMTAALAVAEGTRRSNMSRLRTWLGTANDGEAYLPDAYTGRISLHPAVSSDWHWLQIFTAAGVRRASDDALHAALGLVRGAPLADAAPGQWHWAEELRTDMMSAIRDIGVELSRRCLADGDIVDARWAASRALLAAPGDELLMVARIRTEHRAGNRAEVERLTLQVAAQARQLGVDLEEETVVALQEVMEGRARARFA